MNPEEADRHIDHDALELHLLGRLPPAVADALERHVLNCAECRGRLEQAARSLARENRREPRASMRAAGFLRSFSPLLPERWPVEVIDASKNGIGLLVPVRLSPGVLVQVQFGRTFALGEVRYSKQTGERQFRTGIRLHDIKP